MNRQIIWLWCLLGAFTLVSFQNCGKGFKTQSLDSLSAQCTDTIQKAAPSYNLSASELACGNFDNYGCERRSFSPDFADMTHSLRECLPGNTTCVNVDVHQFDTSAAREADGSNASEFQPGGEYNREEVKCFHRMVYRGVSLFNGEGDSLEEALAKAMSSCEKAEGSQK